jgi:hypothetical protein
MLAGTHWVEVYKSAFAIKSREVELTVVEGCLLKLVSFFKQQCFLRGFHRMDGLEIQVTQLITFVKMPTIESGAECKFMCDILCHGKE